MITVAWLTHVLQLGIKIPPKWDFPGGPGVKNLPSNAGDVGSIPGGGTKILPSTGQLSLPQCIEEPAGCNEGAVQPKFCLRKEVSQKTAKFCRAIILQ